MIAASTSAVSRVMGNSDLMSLLAPMLGEDAVFPFAMTCRSCYFGTKGSGLQMRSRALQFCGSLHLLRWAVKFGCAFNARLSKAAAHGGHLEALQWLRAQTPACPWNKYTCRASAEGGHLEVLQWLRAQTPACPWNHSRCYRNTTGALRLWLKSQKA